MLLPNLAFLVMGESVLIFIPFMTGMAQDATGCQNAHTNRCQNRLEVRQDYYAKGCCTGKMGDNESKKLRLISQLTVPCYVWNSHFSQWKYSFEFSWKWQLILCFCTSRNHLELHVEQAAFWKQDTKVLISIEENFSSFPLQYQPGLGTNSYPKPLVGNQQTTPTYRGWSPKAGAKSVWLLVYRLPDVKATMETLQSCFWGKTGHLQYWQLKTGPASPGSGYLDGSFDFYKAHPAVSCYRESVMVAEPWDFHPGLSTCLE